MNIYALKGHKIKFSHPEGGWPYDQKKAKTHLEVGNTYTVDHTVVHRSSTDVYLEEIPNTYFNSVMFDDVEPQDEEKNKLHSDYYLHHPKPIELQVTAIDVLKVIKEALEEKFGSGFISPTMYHPDNLEKEVSVSFMEKVGLGVYKRFIITVKDNK